MDIKDIQSKFDMNEYRIVSVLDAGDRYIVTLGIKNAPKGSFTDDCQWFVNKKTGEKTIFRASDNQELYRKALNKILYLAEGALDK